MGNVKTFTRSNVAVGTTLEDIGLEIILNHEAQRLALQVTTAAGACALGDFSLLGKVTADSEWATLFTSTAWATVAGILKAKSANINTLAAATSASVLVGDLDALYSVKFQAKVTAQTPVNLDGITLNSTDPVKVSTDGAHGLITGDIVTFASIVGTTELNGNSYTITKVDTDDFTLDGTDSSDFTAYTSDGTVSAINGQVTLTGAFVPA